jgi:hypothetical protein
VMNTLVVTTSIAAQKRTNTKKNCETKSDFESASHEASVVKREELSRVSKPCPKIAGQIEAKNIK